MNAPEKNQLFDSANINWKPISLTFVEYPAGDFIGYCLAWLSLLPIFLVVGLSTLIVFRRDLHSISFLGGILLNELLNLAVKHTVREPRPLRDGNTSHAQYGMPSNHAQFIGFFSTYMVLFLFFRTHHNTKLRDNVWKYILVLGCVLAAVLVSFGRFYLEYHTTHQVVWGVLIGSLSGSAWFCFVHWFLTPRFPLIVSWKICELLLIRDTTLIPNILWFEYTTQRNEARTRQKKQGLKYS